MDIKDLLLKHFNMYPMMQIQDMVKLIYQNEFAGGHMIKNEEESLGRLEEECRFFERLPVFIKEPDDAFEDIGNNLCRLNLAVLNCSSISIETINKFFVNTANSIRGNVKSFEEKLEVLRQCCREGQLPYTLDELEDYLKEYKAKGYPPVSHSQVYRDNYSPCYRIVRAEYREFFEAFEKTDSLMAERSRVVVAIDGNSGAGKSTLAALIGGVYQCNIFHMDDFFLTPNLRTKERLQEAGGNVDYVRFKEEVIEGINSGKEFFYRKFDCSKMAFGQPVKVTPKKLNIIEGSYSMHPALFDNYDLKIFLHIDEETQRCRILKRNGAFMLKRFLNEWIPLENRYFKELNIEEKCDLVFGR